MGFITIKTRIHYEQGLFGPVGPFNAADSDLFYLET